MTWILILPTWGIAFLGGMYTSYRRRQGYPVAFWKQCVFLGAVICAHLLIMRFA